jgi:hypothetical protein
MLVYNVDFFNRARIFTCNTLPTTLSLRRHTTCRTKKQYNTTIKLRQNITCSTVMQCILGPTKRNCYLAIPSPDQRGRHPVRREGCEHVWHVQQGEGGQSVIPALTKHILLTCAERISTYTRSKNQRGAKTRATR